MNDNASKGGGCPDPETLSAYFDGDGADSSEIASHVAACAECAKRLDAYGVVSDKIKANVNSAQPDNLEERIRSLVRERIEFERANANVIQFKPVFLRIAAIIVVGVGLSLYFIGRVLNTQVNSDETGPIDHSTTVASVASDAAHSAGASDFSKLNPGGTVFLSNLEPVSLERHGSSMGISPEKRRRMRSKPTSISNRVHHVWVAHDLAKVEDELRRFANKWRVPAKKMKMTETRDKVKLNMRLTKRELVALIHLCARNGLELLSPQAPQPEQNEFLGDSGDQIQYNADFVLNNH